MESRLVKVLGSDRRGGFDLKRKRAAKFPLYLPRIPRSAVPHFSTLKSSSIKFGKRKKPDTCSKAECRSCKFASCQTLVRYYKNFMNSGIPKHLMFYHLGKWINHDSEVVNCVRKEFEPRKAAVEVNLNNYHLILDFVRMVQFNFKTFAEQPVAWIDDEGCCFFPEVFIDGDVQQSNCRHEVQKAGLASISEPHQEQQIKLEIEIEVNGVDSSKLKDYCGESSPIVKRMKFGQNAESGEYDDEVSDVRMKEDVGENQHLEKVIDVDVEKANADLASDVVKEMFLNGMNVVVGANVIDICPNLGSLKQGQFELFLKQVEITKKCRGYPNVQFAWLASSKEASSSIMTYGLGHFGLQQMKSAYGIGVHLTAANSVDTSVNYCDVDENGVQYMVLCRVILGNMEVVHPGSKQFHPSSQNFDSGVDDIHNPKFYVIWSVNINTHIFPVSVVSFKVPVSHEGCAVKADSKLDAGVKNVPINILNPSNAKTVFDNGGDHQSNLTCGGSKERATLSVPKSPWMPFPMLLSEIAKQVSSSEMKSVIAHYEQYKSKIITRKDLIGKLRLIVGDNLLRSMILELNSKTEPSNNVIAFPNKRWSN